MEPTGERECYVCVQGRYTCRRHPFSGSKDLSEPWQAGEPEPGREECPEPDKEPEPGREECPEPDKEPEPVKEELWVTR